MPRLLVAEQVAGAADVEVVAGELEAGAQAVEGGEDLEPLLGAFGHRAVGRRRHVRIGARLRPADAAAQLVELGEAEAVGAVDDHRVGARDVEPALDDGGRQEHVVAPVVEGAHPLLDLARRHLPVGGDVADLGHRLAQELLDVGQVGDARRDEEALPAAVMLAQQRLAQDDLVPRHDIGADREPVDRRGGDDRQLAQAGERHLQRPRDRGGGQGQHVHAGPQRLQPRPSRVALASDAVTRRLSWRTSTGRPAKRSRKPAKCWRASSVVGQTMATCWPDKAAA